MHMAPIVVMGSSDDPLEWDLPSWLFDEAGVMFRDSEALDTPEHRADGPQAWTSSERRDYRGGLPASLMPAGGWSRGDGIDEEPRQAG
jgi:hypothetical protein